VATEAVAPEAEAAAAEAAVAAPTTLRQRTDSKLQKLDKAPYMVFKEERQWDTFRRSTIGTHAHKEYSAYLILILFQEVTTSLTYLHCNSHSCTGVH
jgi:hypothetical protein